MTDRSDSADELRKVDAALAAQSALRGILPDEQLDAALAVLHNQRALLIAQQSISGGIDLDADHVTIGGDAVGRDKITANATSTQYTATNTGRGSIAQGAGAISAGERGLAAQSIGGDAITGDGNRVVHAQTYVEHPLPPSPSEIAGERYLKKLAQRCNVLPLAALGGDEGAGDEIGLDQVYVTLDTRTRVPLPDDEQAKQRARTVPGREENERTLSALEAATQTKRLILLGDPGSGKSTFVRQLSAWLIAARLKQREPLTEWEADLVPILVSLRELAPRIGGLDLDRMSAPDRERALLAALWDHWRADLKQLNAADFADGLDDALTNGQALLIFDGLDEVPEKTRRAVREAVGAVLRAYPKVPRIIVTSRIRSYTGSAVLPGFTDHTLAPFDQERIRQFIGAWYTAQVHLGRIDRDKADDRVRDLQAAALSSDLRELSSNPMLLTTMVIIHQTDVGLPRERVRLYKRAVEVLLSRWQTRKGIAISAELEAVLKDDLKLRAVVEKLAYETHRAQAQIGNAAQLRRIDVLAQVGNTANLTRKDVLAWLEAPAYLGSIALADQFLDYVDQRAGLLIGVGGDDGVHPSEYNFPHRTFQEYLAGCGLVSGRGISREYRERAREGDFWHLAARLGAEELYYNRRNVETLLDLAYDLCPTAEPQQAADWRCVVWSGRMAVLAGAAEIRRDAEKPDGGQHYLDRLAPRLVAVLEGDVLGPIERAAAGRVLARLGDPRPAALTVDAMPFCFVPHGEFVMGDEDKEHVNRSLDYDYWISRYPITNAQFAAFVEAGGYGERRYWPEAEAHQVWQAGRVQGRYDDEPRRQAVDYGDHFNLPNDPVVGIIWYEALAFARWLTETLRSKQLLPDQYEVRLPSEAEWEKAARGGVQLPTAPLIGPVVATPEITLRQNDRPRRVYPWGDQPDVDRANYDESKVGIPTAVGTFARGASPYGAQDMSGNVWEWTRSVYQPYPYDPQDGREQLDSKDTRVLRGGAFYFDERFARCAFRFNGNPDVRLDNIGFRVVVVPF